MYSKSANVNDLHGFCVDRLAPLFAWSGPSPCSYGFSASWFAMAFRGTLHHPYICPCFWRKHFYTPLVYAHSSYCGYLGVVMVTWIVTLFCCLRFDRKHLCWNRRACSAQNTCRLTRLWCKDDKWSKNKTCKGSEQWREKHV